jgi:hypothetical protein
LVSCPTTFIPFRLPPLLSCGPNFKSILLILPGCEIARHSDGLLAGQTRFNSHHKYEIFLCSKTFRPALKLTKPPIQWAPGAFSPERRPVRETDHSTPSSVKVKNGWVTIPLLRTSSRHDV